MKVVFLLGNGFDLNCGLKSSYKDMYEGYCTSASPSETITQFKSEINRDILRWSDFEKALGEYGAKVKSEDELLECARDFKRYLSKYLAAQSELFEKRLMAMSNHSFITDEFSKSLKLFYDNCGFPMSLVRNIHSTEMFSGMDISIINFNYTNTVEIINNYIEKNHRSFVNSDVIHIHGELTSDDIVLGVDNTSQILTSYNISHRLERGIVKPVFNEEYDKEKINRVKERLEGADVICAFGMSFGITDNTWKKLIIDSLREKSEQILIFYDYDMSSKVNLTIDQRMDESDEFKRMLSSKWELDIPEEIMKKIYVPCGKNIFNIDNAIKMQVQRELKIRGVSPTLKKANVN